MLSLAFRGLRVMVACMACGVVAGLLFAVVLVVLSLHGRDPALPQEAPVIVMLVGAAVSFPWVRKHLAPAPMQKGNRSRDGLGRA